MQSNIAFPVLSQRKIVAAVKCAKRLLPVGLTVLMMTIAPRNAETKAVNSGKKFLGSAYGTGQKFRIIKSRKNLKLHVGLVYPTHVPGCSDNILTMQHSGKAFGHSDRALYLAVLSDSSLLALACGCPFSPTDI